MKNGLIEQDYRAGQAKDTTNTANKLLGPSVFSEGATTWKGLKVEPAKMLLAFFLQNDTVPSWFRHSRTNLEALEGSIAPKAVRFELGVQEDTEIPIGYGAMGNRLELIKWLADQRRTTTGKLFGLEGLKQTNLDTMADCFRLDLDEDQKTTVWTNTTPSTKLDMGWIPLANATDWVILAADRFENAVIHSSKLKVNNPIWVFVPDDIVPVFDEAFHYSEDMDHPTYSRNFLSSASASVGASSAGCSTPLRSSAGSECGSPALRRGFRSPTTPAYGR